MVALERQILPQLKVQHGAMLVPVLRNMTGAKLRAEPHALFCAVHTVDLNGAGLYRSKAADGVNQFPLAVAVNTGDAQDLTRACLERNVVDGILVMQL